MILFAKEGSNLIRGVESVLFPQRFDVVFSWAQIEQTQLTLRVGETVGPERPVSFAHRHQHPIQGNVHFIFHLETRQSVRFQESIICFAFEQHLINDRLFSLVEKKHPACRPAACK